MRKYLITFLLSQDDKFYHEDTVGIEMEANDLKELFNIIGDVETDVITSSRIVRAVEGSGLVFDSYAPIVIGEFNEDGITKREKLFPRIGRVRDVNISPDGFVILSVEGEGIFKVIPN